MAHSNVRGVCSTSENQHFSMKLLGKESTIKTRQNQTKNITKPCRNHFCKVFVSLLRVDNHELISDYRICLVIFFTRIQCSHGYYYQCNCMWFLFRLMFLHYLWEFTFFGITHESLFRYLHKGEIKNKIRNFLVRIPICTYIWTPRKVWLYTSQ